MASDSGTALGVLVIVREREFVAPDHLLDHAGGGDARQVGATGGGGERQAEADQVVGGIADYGLVEIADLDLATLPSASASGPRLPRWQSPQIQTAGPAGKLLGGWRTL